MLFIQTFLNLDCSYMREGHSNSSNVFLTDGIEMAIISVYMIYCTYGLSAIKQQFPGFK